MQNCFVCNLPILSHQVGLVWQGGNGVDDLLREQMENVSAKNEKKKKSFLTTKTGNPELLQDIVCGRLGCLSAGRRDSSAQITTIESFDDYSSNAGGSGPASSSGAGAADGAKSVSKRRRSSLAQLTDLLRDLSGGGSRDKSSSGKGGPGEKGQGLPKTNPPYSQTGLPAWTISVILAITADCSISVS